MSQGGYPEYHADDHLPDGPDPIRSSDPGSYAWTVVAASSSTDYDDFVPIASISDIFTNHPAAFSYDAVNDGLIVNLGGTYILRLYVLPDFVASGANLPDDMICFVAPPTYPSGAIVTGRGIPQRIHADTDYWQGASWEYVISGPDSDFPSGTYIPYLKTSTGGGAWNVDMVFEIVRFGSAPQTMTAMS